MIKSIRFKISLLFSIGFMAISCTEAIDFDQADDIVLTPALEASLVYFDEPASRFVDNGSTILSIQDFISVAFFNDEFVVDNVEKAEFVFETQNTINRTFELQVDFLDQAGNLQHSLTVREDAAPDNTDTVTTYTEVFEGNSLSALKRTVAIVFTMRLLPGAPLDEDTVGRIQYKSYAAFYINLNK
ncbi:hypothetical protein [Algibacter sp. L3A6]|uniref:hypothetical protein n=1 Tax=Algibacter sp. L3A6 TaxID=2686366 RepID=UPI00131CD811|nr:hypothetical protein [Algibacter sp. L3A6]